MRKRRGREDKSGLNGGISIPPNVYGERLSGTLSLPWAVRKLRSANNGEEREERLMSIIAAVQVVATATLLVAHLAVVVRNRFAQRN